jgi:chromosome partitioning protein
MLCAVASTKGGSGKTSTVVNTASVLAGAENVLAVDLDPQASLSRWYGVEGPGLASVLSGDKKLTEVIYADEDFGFDLAASSRRLRRVDDLSPIDRPLRRLVHEHYDLCLIDTPPTAGRFTSAAIETAGRVLIPIEASMAAMDTLADSIAAVRQLGAEVVGVLVCRVDRRTKNDISVQPHLKDQYGDLVFDVQIREAVAVRDSNADRIPTVTYDPSNNAARDYHDAALELKARLDYAQ